MDLLSLLKKLKAIEADREYAEKSKRIILSVSPAPKMPMTIGRFLIQSFQTGSTIALTGLLLVLIVGGFSVGQLLTPFRLSSLNPESLRAEAEAVDIQITLTDLKYKDAEGKTPSLGNQKTTQSGAITDKNEQELSPEETARTKKEIMRQAEELGIDVSSSSENVLTIDEALKKLGE